MIGAGLRFRSRFGFGGFAIRLRFPSGIEGRFRALDEAARLVVAAARLAESRELAVASSNVSAADSRVSPSTEKTVDATTLVLVAMVQFCWCRIFFCPRQDFGS
jgi:hypothetical protein